MGPTPSHVPAQIVTLNPTSEVNFKEYLEIVRRRKLGFIQVFLVVMVVGIFATMAATPIYQTSAKLKVPQPVAGTSLYDARNPVRDILYQPDPLATQIEVIQSSRFMGLARERAKVEDQSIITRVENVPGTNIIQVTTEGESREGIANLANAIADLHAIETSTEANSGTELAKTELRTQKKLAEGVLDSANKELQRFNSLHRVPVLTAQQESKTQEYVALRARVTEAEANVTSTRAELDEKRAYLSREPRTLEETVEKDNLIYTRLQDRMLELEAKKKELEPLYQDNSPEITEIQTQLDAYAQQLKKYEAVLTTKRKQPNRVWAELQADVRQLEARLSGYQAAQNAATAKFQASENIVDEMGPFGARYAQLMLNSTLALRNVERVTEALNDMVLKGNIRFQGTKTIQMAVAPTSPIRPRKEVNFLLTLVLALCLATGFALLQEFLDDRINSPEDVERIGSLITLGHIPFISQTQVFDLSREDLKALTGDAAPEAEGAEGTALARADRSRDQAVLFAEIRAKSPMAEAYRGLRSNIGFAGIEKPIRRIQVTSATSGEGKTTTAVNLAMAMAMDGKRVVLIDGDLRKPKVFAHLGLEPGPGLAEVIVGTETFENVSQRMDPMTNGRVQRLFRIRRREIELLEEEMRAAGAQNDEKEYRYLQERLRRRHEDLEVLRESTQTLHENLTVLTAGNRPPNPAELLGSASFAELLKKLDEQHDVIVVDSPPCMLVTDPILISVQVDGVALVLQAGKTKKAAIRSVVSQIQRAHARVLGVVFNQSRKKTSGTYGYGYGYGYGYSYGYGGGGYGGGYGYGDGYGAGYYGEDERRSGRKGLKGIFGGGRSKNRRGSTASRSLPPGSDRRSR